MFATSQHEKMNPSQILTLEPIQRSNKGTIKLDNWVSIKVTNNHLEDMVECFGHLEINGEPVTLSWHINPPNGLETIRGNTSSLLNVARTKIEKTDGFCVTGQEGDFPTFPQGKYHIRISVGGKINNSKIIPAVFLGQLICENNSLILGGLQISDSGMLPNPTMKKSNGPQMTDQLHIAMNRKTFQSKLEDKFSLDDIRTICSHMGIKYENLGGINTLKSRVRELMLLCEREQRLLELIFYITEERPKAQWYKLEE